MISGPHKLYPALEQTEKTRIRIGLQTDQKTFELLQQARGQQELLLRSHAEVKEELSAEVLSELEHGNDGAQLEQGKRNVHYLDQVWETSGQGLSFRKKVMQRSTS